MKQIEMVLKTYFISFLLAISVFSCKPLIALYDQYAYTQATSLKVDMQNLVKKSGTVNYTDAKVDIEKVNTELQKAYEYDKGRLKNINSTVQYERLLADDGFYKSFLKTWESQGKESPTAADEMSNKIGQLIDEVIKLENGKNKPNK